MTIDGALLSFINKRCAVIAWSGAQLLSDSEVAEIMALAVYPVPNTSVAHKDDFRK
jgi:hypothetical protein